MSPDEHKAAAEEALADAHGHPNPSIPLMRGITHAILALADDEATCTHCNDDVRLGHTCPECGLYEP